jgi:hypothetical protein
MNVVDAVDRLRRRRGGQRVTFDHVADHLVDFAERHPERAAAVADFAEFLATVENVEHDHAAAADHSEIREQG